MRNELLLSMIQEKIEERKKYGFFCPMATQKLDPRISSRIKMKLEKMDKEKTLYEFVMDRIVEMKDSRFFFKNKSVNSAAFYRYARIDKSTWTDLCYGQVKMKKKTLLKLVIALKLDEEMAIDFMKRAASSFDPKDTRDQIILALIDLKCYEIEDVYDALEEYRNMGHNFENIYD